MERTRSFWTKMEVSRISYGIVVIIFKNQILQPRSKGINMICSLSHSIPHNNANNFNEELDLNFNFSDFSHHS